jgi:hypothetical protein
MRRTWRTAVLVGLLAALIGSEVGCDSSPTPTTSTAAGQGGTVRPHPGDPKAAKKAPPRLDD